MAELQFGKIVRVTQKGDTAISEETNYSDSVPAVPIKYRYERRVFVQSQKEEMTEYLKFSDLIHKFKDNVTDVSWRIEKSQKATAKGGYYVVECWTELDNFQRLL